MCCVFLLFFKLENIGGGGRGYVRPKFVLPRDFLNCLSVSSFISFSVSFRSLYLYFSFSLGLPIFFLSLFLFSVFFPLYIYMNTKCRTNPWQGPMASSIFGPLDIFLPLKGCMGPCFWSVPAIGGPLGFNLVSLMDKCGSVNTSSRNTITLKRNTNETAHRDTFFHGTHNSSHRIREVFLV